MWTKWIGRVFRGIVRRKRDKFERKLRAANAEAIRHFEARATSMAGISLDGGSMLKRYCDNFRAKCETLTQEALRDFDAKFGYSQTA